MSRDNKNIKTLFKDKLKTNRFKSNLNDDNQPQQNGLQHNKGEFLDIHVRGSDRSSTGSYTVSCFASPLRNRKFKKSEVEKRQKMRIEDFYQEDEKCSNVIISDDNANNVNVKAQNGIEKHVGNDSHVDFINVPGLHKKSNTMEFNSPQQLMSPNKTSVKKTFLQRSQSFLSKLSSRSPKTKKQEENNNSSSSLTHQLSGSSVVRNLIVEDEPTDEMVEHRDVLSSTLRGLCDSNGDPIFPGNLNNIQEITHPSHYFPSLTSPQVHLDNDKNSGPSSAPSQSHHPMTKVASKFAFQRSAGRLSDISEESCPGEAKSSNPSINGVHGNEMNIRRTTTAIQKHKFPSDLSAFHRTSKTSDAQKDTSILRKKPPDGGYCYNNNNEVLPQRPSSAHNNHASFTNLPPSRLGAHQLALSSHSANRMNKKCHSTSMLPSNHFQQQQHYFSEQQDEVARQSRLSQCSSDPRMRSQSELPHSRMSSFTSDLDSGSPGSSGVGSCKELRSALPLVRSPNRSMEKPLGQVFLTHNEETKRAQLPNEVTSLDTVKALFVRSFPKCLTMQWFDSAQKKIYILDRATNVYYELDDLKEVRDRSQLKIYELDMNVLSPTNRNPKIFGNIVPEAVALIPNAQVPCFIPQTVRNDQNNSKSPTKGTAASTQRHSVPCFPNNTDSYSLTFNNNNSNNNHNNTHNNIHNSRSRLEFHSYENSANSSGTITPLNGLISDGSERERMLKMETQIASLSALVQSLSGKQTNNAPAQHNNSRHNSIQLTNSNLSGDSACASYNNISSMITNDTLNPFMSRSASRTGLTRFAGLSKKVRDLRKELHQIRDLQVTFMRNLTFSIQHIIGHCMNSSFGDYQAKFFEASSAGLWLEKYKHESIETGNGLRDLEFLVEELRCDVVNRKCRVNVMEVEGFAFNLSQLSRSLARLKNEFPKLQEITTKAMTDEMQVIEAEEKFISEEPSRIDRSLKQTRKLMGVLYTLKKLSALQSKQRIDAPSIGSKEELAEVDKKLLLANIESIEPDHETRAIKLEKSLRARELKKKLTTKLERAKFDNQLRLIRQHLKVTNNIEVNLNRSQNMLILMYEQQMACSGKRLSYDAQNAADETGKSNPNDDGCDSSSKARTTHLLGGSVNGTRIGAVEESNNKDVQSMHGLGATTFQSQNREKVAIEQAAADLSAATARPSLVTKFKSANVITSPPVGRRIGGIPRQNVTFRKNVDQIGVASETDESSFGLSSLNVQQEESESEDACCSQFSTIKRTPKSKDPVPPALRSSTILLPPSPIPCSNSVSSVFTSVTSPLVLTPPSTLAITTIAITPTSSSKPPLLSITTTTFTKPPTTQNKLPSSFMSSKNCPPPVPVRKTSALTKNLTPSNATSPLYCNIQEMKQASASFKNSLDSVPISGQTENGTAPLQQPLSIDDKNDDANCREQTLQEVQGGSGISQQKHVMKVPEEPRVIETHFGMTSDFEDVKRNGQRTTDVRRSAAPPASTLKVSRDNHAGLNKCVTTTTGHPRKIPQISSKIETHSSAQRRRAQITSSSTLQQEGILSRPAHKAAAGGRPKNVKFKPDGKKCEETEIN